MVKWGGCKGREYGDGVVVRWWVCAKNTNEGKMVKVVIVVL